jgi:hypothetical protein
MECHGGGQDKQRGLELWQMTKQAAVHGVYPEAEVQKQKGHFRVSGLDVNALTEIIKHGQIFWW